MLYVDEPTTQLDKGQEYHCQYIQLAAIPAYQSCVLGGSRGEGLASASFQVQLAGVDMYIQADLASGSAC